MSLCTVCGHALCAHTAEQRGQTYDELRRPLTKEERALWDKKPRDFSVLTALAKKNAHLSNHVLVT